MLAPSTQTEETTTAEAEAPELDIMAIALAADRELAETSDEPEPTPGKKPAADKPATPGEQGEATDKKPKADAKAPEGKKPDEAPKKPEEKATEFQKAKAEQDRRDRSWKALEEEKAAFRQDKQAIVAELQGLRRELTQLKAKPAGPAKDSHGNTAADYDKMAKQYEEEGDDRMAKAARERAETLRHQAPAPDAPAAEPWKSPEFQAEWQRTTQELIAATPELADPQNPIVKAANTICNHPEYGRLIKAHPSGIKAAVEIAQLMQRAAATEKISQELTTAREELTKQKAEVERLNGLLQPRRSRPAAPARGDKSISELSDDDILAIAADADRSAN